MSKCESTVYLLECVSFPDDDKTFHFIIQNAFPELSLPFSITWTSDTTQITENQNLLICFKHHMTALQIQLAV